MPNTIKNIPFDTSQVLLRQAYKNYSNVFKTFYEQIMNSEPVTLNEFKRIKVVYHFIESTGLSAPSDGYLTAHPSLKNVFETNANIILDLADTDPEGNDLPFPGVNIIQGDSIPNQRRGGNLVSYVKDGLHYFTENVRGIKTKAMTLEYFKNAVAWDTTKYLNVYIVNSLKGLDSEGIGSIEIPYSAENPLVVNVLQKLNLFGITIPYWAFPNFRMYPTETYDYELTNHTHLHAYASATHNYQVQPLVSSLWKGIVTSLGIMQRNTTISFFDGSEYFFNYDLDYCQTNDDCFYLNGRGNCKSSEDLLPINLRNVLNKDTQSECSEYVLTNHYITYDYLHLFEFPNFLNIFSEFSNTLLVGKDIDFVKQTPNVSINFQSTPFILHSLYEFADSIAISDPTYGFGAINSCSNKYTITYSEIQNSQADNTSDWIRYLETYLVPTQTSANFELIVNNLNNSLNNV